MLTYVEEYQFMQDNNLQDKPEDNLSTYEYDFIENVDEQILIDSLNTDIIKYINQSTCDLKLLSQLNELVREYGNIACQIIFKVIADLHLDRDAAFNHWIQVNRHSLWLKKQVGRPLPLVATICDYFSNHKDKLISKPKLTTLEHFDSLINHSTIDRLTGLFNRNCFNDTLTHLIALTQREDTELSLVIMDLDDFKLINDTYGHQMGDMVLHKFGELLSSSIRKSDIALRYGGEEFVILMPNTNHKDALMLSNRIRSNVKNMLFIENDTKLHLSISGGLAVFPTQAKTAEELIYSADSALYRAKGAGKNNIKVFKNENRHYLRVPLVKNIKIKEINFDGATIQKAICQDICFGGVLFETSQQYHVRDSIQIAIDFNDDNPIFILGSVVRVEQIADDCFSIAVSFSFGDMEKLAKNKIAGIIEKHEQSNQST
jgi:diguanylate cyclase (GGDEF)-like protein